jgi:alpha-beta hydrolase superfamily lysophospholipase
MATLTAPDGTQLVYDACEPVSPRAALLFLHGWSDHAGRWIGLSERLREAGYAVYALDQRGHGRSGGRRGHLSRFSQLLGDLQAFRRAVRCRRAELRHVFIGHSFGGLVTLRYLETQPSDPVSAAVVSSPWLALAAPPARLKLALARVLADLWPTLPIPVGLDVGLLSRDPATNSAYESDPSVHRVMTPGAWREIQWAQRAVPADGARIDVPLLFLLAGEDRVVDAQATRAFAAALAAPVEVRWYPEMFHEVLHDPQQEQVVADLITFLANHGLA